MKDIKYIIGIDEVGRGPVAGPVAVGAFMCAPDFFNTIEIKTPLRDSKKLSEKQRNEWFVYLKSEKVKGNCDFAISYVSAEMIDKFGISKAIKKSLEKSLQKVTSADCGNFLSRCGRAAVSDRERRGISEENFHNLQEFYIYLDGGLKAPEEYVNQETIIRGDQLHPVISCASIVAKVSRDAVMTNLAKDYPEYGFENHAGYGTTAHYAAIKKHGFTPLHRKSFLKNL